MPRTSQTAEQTSRDDERGIVLAAPAPALPEEERTAVLRQALETAGKIKARADA
jgi:hypothetical protein